MKRFSTFFILLLWELSLLAQVAPQKYVVYFTDKNNNPYSISDPQQFLSARSLQRRSNQLIPIELSDLPVTPSYIAGVKNVGVNIINVSKWLNSATFYTTDSALVEQVAMLPYVKKLVKSHVGNNTHNKFSSGVMSDQVNYKIPYSGIQTNNPVQATYKSSNTDVYNYGGAYNQIHMLNGDVLHNLGYDGAGMVIAVLDAGFWHVDQLAAFDSLWNNDQILGTRDFVEPGSNVFRDDIHMHGMMVLSTMGGNKPGELVGTAPKASFWLIRTEDGPTENIIEEYNWVSGAEFADSVGADVINSSLGYTEFDDPSQNHIYADMDGNTAPSTIGADLAARKGILVVNSAGNSAQNAWHYVGAPADADSVLTVGAVDGFGNYAAFSSTGPTADGRVKPNVVSQGQGSAIIGPDGATTYGNGTSFSSPIMAGVAACLWQAHPNLKNMEIIQVLQQAANQTTAPDSLLGFGIPDFMVAHGLLASDNHFEKTNFIDISPNPFDSYLTVNTHFLTNSRIFINICDMNGRVVFSSASDNLPVITLNNLNSLAKGVYVLRVSSNSTVITQKVIKL